MSKTCKDCKWYDSKIRICTVNDNDYAHVSELSTTCSKFADNSTVKKQGNDAVNHPAHYTQGGIECIDALKAATVNLKGIEAVCTANALKYLWRWREKNGVEDLKKSIWYIERLIKEVETDDM